MRLGVELAFHLLTLGLYNSATEHGLLEEKTYIELTIFKE